MQSENPKLPPEALHDFEVLDASGHHIGAVNHVWVPDGSEEPRLLGVRTGWLLGKTEVVPAAEVRIDLTARTLQLPYTREDVKGAPRLEESATITPEFEDAVLCYYQRLRPAAPAAPADVGAVAAAPTSGLASAPLAQPAAVAPTADVVSEVAIPLAEEQLVVGKREVESGRVRLRKVVRTEHVQQAVELRHEEIIVERIPATGAEISGGAFQEQEIEMSALREEPVVAKEVHVTGQVRLQKNVETVTQMVHGEVRRETVEVDQEGAMAPVARPVPRSQ